MEHVYPWLIDGILNRRSHGPAEEMHKSERLVTVNIRQDANLSPTPFIVRGS